MRNHGHKKHKKDKKSKKSKKYTNWNEEEEEYGLDEDDYDEPAEGEWDGRKEAFRMFAPGLWEKANRRHGRHSKHGPMVGASKDEKDNKDATADWPKMHKMCPVMLFFIFASIYQICHIKFLEKAEAKLQLLFKAKKLIKKEAKKSCKIPTQPVVPVQYVPVSQPAPQKKCKKVAKMEKVAQ